MEDKKRFGKGVVVGVCTTLIVVIILAAFSVGVGLVYVNPFIKLSQENVVSSDETSAESVSDRVSKKIDTIMKMIDAYYLEEYDADELVDGALSGLVSALGDPYSVYYSKESYDALLEDNSGSYYGIGVVVSQNTETGEVLVVNPYENCPGAEAGMLPGDIIYKVEGVEVTGMDLNEVVAMIRGEENTSIIISVLHEGDSELTDLTVTRRKIETHTVEHEVLEGNIGYVQVTQFDEVTTEQFKEAMEDLKSQGIESLIVDLRDNPGGSLTVVIDMLDMVLPKGTYTYLIDKNGRREDYAGKSDATYDYPMVVLVNGNSASAAELFTGATHDYGVATVVGTTTFGKGIVQQIFPLRDGTGLKVTMAKYYTPSGVCIHKTGIEPDITVELDEGEYPSRITYEEDEQLQKAVEILK